MVCFLSGRGLCGAAFAEHRMELLCCLRHDVVYTQARIAIQLKLYLSFHLQVLSHQSKSNLTLVNDSVPSGRRGHTARNKSNLRYVPTARPQHARQCGRVVQGGGLKFHYLRVRGLEPHRCRFRVVELALRSSPQRCRSPQRCHYLNVSSHAGSMPTRSAGIQTSATSYRHRR